MVDLQANNTEKEDRVSPHDTFEAFYQTVKKDNFDNCGKKITPADWDFDQGLGG